VKRIETEAPFSLYVYIHHWPAGFLYQPTQLIPGYPAMSMAGKQQTRARQMNRP
jgi:hypothetical protein